MQKDVRGTVLYDEAEALYTALRQPGTGRISDAADAHVSPDGRYVVFAGTLMDRLEGMPPTRICRVDVESGDVRVLTFGPHADRLPKFSTDGYCVAFLSDRHREGDFQLYLLDPFSGVVRAAPAVDGWVEYLHWSPDGRRILLGVAGHGADVAGGQGAVTTRQVHDVAPSWMPTVDNGSESHQWRRVWVYELATNRICRISASGLNIWEAAWCGDEAIAAVVSTGPGEGLWYQANLEIIEVATGSSRCIYKPPEQLGWPAASPSGKSLAIVEALCSDRWFVAGDLRLIDTATGMSKVVDTLGVDISHTEWRSERLLLVAGHRGLETVVGIYDTVSDCFAETWMSRDLTCGGFFARVSGFGETGDCVLIGEGFLREPEIAMIRRGEYQSVKSFGHGQIDTCKLAVSVDCLTWRAPDGLEIQGWLVRPRREGPHALLMYVHGGPVWHWRPQWLGRGAAIWMLIKRGYAIFFPNPRGSSGRGRNFARHVLGDMGGADTYDYVSGLDHLVEQGFADPGRLGVIGGSYGGFMAAWLITQDTRFAAAVAVAPVTNQVTERLISNIPHFVDLFLADRYYNPSGKFFARSPIMYAHRVKTPTLNICGALDRCTPPEEAMQFHNALLESQVRSVLLTYPEEGHGIRKFPAAIDCAARVVAWFEEHVPAQAAGAIHGGMVARVGRIAQ